MAWIPGGAFTMGAEGFYPEEAPTRKVTVDGFWIDAHPVTNAQYALFVQETRHPTAAERPDYGERGSMVFVQPSGPVPLRDWRAWWEFRPGTCWRHPQGPSSSIRGLSAHPVVHLAYADAQAYAHWAGKELPTEAEWEYAARGGLDGLTYPWGDEPEPDGQPMANTWQGIFPWLDQGAGGHGTTPVGAFPANGHGLLDTVGNVWEWTSDYYRAGSARFDGIDGIGGIDGIDGIDMERSQHLKNEAAENPRVDTPTGAVVFASRVIKGGSYLCSTGYDHRFRPAARLPESVATGSCHLGFRCVRRPG